MGSLKKSSLIETRLKLEANNLNEVEKICSLVIDDMSIKEKLEYSRPEDKFFGLCNGKKVLLVKSLPCVLLFMAYRLNLPFLLDILFTRR